MNEPNTISFDQSGTGSNDNKEVFHTPQSTKTWVSLPDAV